MASSRIRPVITRILLSMAAAISLYVLLDNTLGLSASKHAAGDLKKMEAAYAECQQGGKTLPEIIICLNEQKKSFWDVKEFVAPNAAQDHAKAILFSVRYHRLWATTHCSTAGQGAVTCALHGW